MEEKQQQTRQEKQANWQARKAGRQAGKHSTSTTTTSFLIPSSCNYDRRYDFLSLPHDWSSTVLSLSLAHEGTSPQYFHGCRRERTVSSVHVSTLHADVVCMLYLVYIFCVFKELLKNSTWMKVNTILKNYNN